MVHLAEFRSEGLDTQSPCYNQLQALSRARVPCRGSRVTFFFPNIFWKR